VKSTEYFTLYNSPTFIGSYGGYLNFDSIYKQYAESDVYYNTDTYTIEIWLYWKDQPNGIRYPCIVTTTYDNREPNDIDYVFYIPNDNNNHNNMFYGYTTTTNGFIGGTYTLTDTETWYYLAMTLSPNSLQFYVNGVLQNTITSLPAFPHAREKSTYLMKRWDVPGTYDPGTMTNSNGGIAILRIYNTAISGTKIADTYNREKSRFYNPPPVLPQPIIHLDAANTASYNPAQPTQWNNLVRNTGLYDFTLYGNDLPSYEESPGALVFNYINGRPGMMFQYAQNNDVFPYTQWSIEVWYYFGGTGLNGHSIVNNIYNYNYKICYALGAINEFPQHFENLYTWIFDGSHPQYNTATPFVLSRGTWNHLVGCYDGSNTMTLYSNKTLVSSTNVGPISFATPNQSGTLLCRGWDLDYADFISGKLGIVRMYDHALTLQDVVALYEKDKSRF